jgi:hypothetical protein
VAAAVVLVLMAAAEQLEQAAQVAVALVVTQRVH